MIRDTFSYDSWLIKVKRAGHKIKHRKLKILTKESSLGFFFPPFKIKVTIHIDP